MPARTAVPRPGPLPAATPRPRRSDARRNYERLIVAAKAAFAEHGADTLLDDIARSAGLGVGTLYRHFPTREALLEAVGRDWTETVEAESTALLAETDPVAALATWLQALVGHMSVYRGVVAALVASMDDEASALHPSCQVIAEAGERLLDRARDLDAVRPEVTVAELLQLVTGVVWVAEQQLSADRDRLLALVVDSLRPNPYPVGRRTPTSPARGRQGSKNSAGGRETGSTGLRGTEIR